MNGANSLIDLVPGAGIVSLRASSFAQRATEDKPRFGEISSTAPTGF